MSLHTSAQYEQELRKLKERLLAMGGRCEALIRRAIVALETRDAKLADEVTEHDREIDADEMAVDDLAVRILALRQPVGRDLRFLMTAIKVVTDLERIGDEAVNIAERAGELAAEPTTPLTSQRLAEMAASASSMLHDALDAFVQEDADKATKVLLADDDVDNLYGDTMRATHAFIAANPSEARAAMAVASCAKYVERIADHSTNIAEMVVYMVRGVDVRHGGRKRKTT
jgi:phosphate transport system protein